jgi:hypothetical protein
LQMLNKAYGGTKIPPQETRPRRDGGSPSSHGASRLRPESSGNRLTSGDARLKGIASVYSQKFPKVGSQKTIGVRYIGVKKPFQGGNPRARGGYGQLRDGEE